MLQAGAIVIILKEKPCCQIFQTSLKRLLSNQPNFETLRSSRI